MKKFMLMVVLLQGIICLSCTNQSKKDPPRRRPDSVTMVSTDTMIQATDTNVIAIPAQSWGAFETYNGKYAHDISLFDQPPLKDRFKRLLGKDAKAFLERHKVTPPIDIEHAVLFTEGCRPHDCTLEESALVVDMTKDEIYAGIAIKKQVRMFSEKGDTAWPAKLLEWKNKFSE
jgi:hypothetical protein